MSKIIGLASTCRDCPNRRYESGGVYHCEKVNLCLQANCEIPDWCPLPNYPAQAAQPVQVHPDFTAQYRADARAAIQSGGWSEAIKKCLPVAECFFGSDGEVINPSPLSTLIEGGGRTIAPLFVAQPAQVPDTSAKTWCEYVAGMVGCYLGEPVDSDKCKAIAAIIERRLWALPAAPEVKP